MAKISKRDLAECVTLMEGKKKVLNIADVSEVIRCTFTHLAQQLKCGNVKASEVLALVESYEQ